MKDTKKIIRQAVFDAITGQIVVDGYTLPVCDEKLPNGTSSDFFIILSTQQETTTEINDACFLSNSAIDIEILQKTGTEVSKDDIDSAYQQVMEIILPSPGVHGLTVPSGFSFKNGIRENCVTQSVSITDTESVLICRFKLNFLITQTQ